MTYPNLHKALVNIARDSGRRAEVADYMLRALNTAYAAHVLDAVDKELAAFTPDQFDSVTVGEQGVVPTSSTLETVLDAAADLAGLY
jgi:hypothetical protein